MKMGHLAKSTTLLCFLLGSSAALNASDAVELEAITVQSSTIDDRFESKKTEVSSTAVRSGEEIEKHHAENIANVLNTVPGVTARINEGDSNKIHIRGIGTEMYMGERPGVAIVIDGVPVQERAGSVNIDVDNIESIKIIKGGASYLYGNDALAGAVVITTKRPKATSGGIIATEQGSYGYEKYLANYTASTDNFAAMLQGSYKASDGYWDNSDYWTKSVNGKLQYYIDDTSDLTFGADLTKRYENDSGSITHTTYNKTTDVYTNNVETNPTSVGEVGYSTDYDIDLSKFFLTYSKDFTETSNLMAQIYRYEDTTENKSSKYDSNGDGVDDDHYLDAYANTLQVGIKSELRNDSDVLASMIGLDLANNEEDKNSVYRVDRLATKPWETDIFAGTVNSDTSFTEKIRAIYGEVKYGITDQLVASANVRYDDMVYDYSENLSSTSWEKDFEEISYRVGAVYKFNPDSIVYTSVSTGFRVPTIDQLYAGDILSGRYTYENNPDIDTEKTYNYEIGYRGRADLFEYEVSIFQLNRDDMIVRNGGNYVSDVANPIQYGNFADIRNRGLELSLNSDRAKTLSFDLAYTYLDSKYTRYDNYTHIVYDGVVLGEYDLSGNSVPRISKHTVYFSADYKILHNWSLTAEANHRSSQWADEMNTVKVAGYEVYNLRTKYNTALFGYETELFAKVDNVFDEQYYMMPRVTGDRNEDGVYDERDMGLTVNPGRVFYAGLSISF